MLACGKPKEEVPASMVSEISSKSKEVEMQKEKILELKANTEQEKKLKESEATLRKDAENNATFWRTIAIFGIVLAFVAGIPLGSKTKKAAIPEQQQSVEPRK